MNNKIKKLFESKKAEYIGNFGDTPVGRERTEFAALRCVARELKKENPKDAKSVFFALSAELSAYNRGVIERHVWNKI